MQNLVLSPVPISDLVSMIANEVVAQISKQAQQTIKPESEPKRLYGDKEAAVYLGCSILTVGKLRQSRQITYYRYGRKFYYISNELDEALKVPRRFGESRGKRLT